MNNKKVFFAWAFYDWANSVYSLVIASAIFPIFYSKLFNDSGIEYLHFWGYELRYTALITFVTAFAFLIVSVISPLLSGIADVKGNKKTFMQFFCYLGASSCVALATFDLSRIYISMLFYFLGLIGFWGSLVFYNSYLPDIASKPHHDKLSARGYALGYIGSVILLIINLCMVMFPSLFGIEGNESHATTKAMRISFVTVGIWWILFSQYTFYHLPKTTKKKKNNLNQILSGYNELKKVWHTISQNTILKAYLLAFFVYSMAVQTIMLIATYFGEQEISWKNQSSKTMGLIICILIIQLVAIFGALITSKLSEKYGNIKTLILINFIWAAICIYAYYMITPLSFYIAAFTVGLVMGGIQSLSRSTYSKLLPKTTDTTSFFSFYDVTEKIGIVIGMGLYGLVDHITGSMRNSVILLLAIFILGIILLFKVPKNKWITN